jgi:peptidoglycan-N-acetylglucosamine deacetylase
MVPASTGVSFVVIAYNEAANIARTLDAIAALDGFPEREVIVVDDGSRDRTAEIVRDIAKSDPRVRLVELGDNRGRGFARHTGVAAARGDLIATVDADTILPPDWLVRAMAAMPGHDAVGGTPVPDGDVAYLHRRFGLRPRSVTAAVTVTGSNGLYRREVFDVVSYDPALREGEDVALNHAMRRRGLPIAVVPGLVARHEEDKSFGASVRWLFASGRGATRQLLTYREIRQPDVAAGGFVAVAALGLLAAARQRRALGAALPAAYITAVSVQHVRSRFDTSRSPLTRVAPAVVTDGVLLTSYFLGRLAGLTALRRRR